jgi:hypothetical protein
VPDHYCTLDDVNALVSQVPFGPTSKPTDAQVIQIIENTAVRLDASMANIGYVVPVVSGAIALGMLREVCAWGALGLAQTSRDTGVRTAVSASGKEAKNIWLQMYDSWIERLQDPQDPFELPDAARTDEQLEKQGENVLRSSVQSLPDANWLTPAVTRGQVL